jgi:hypothetical protein
LTGTPARGYEVERMRPLATCLAAALLAAAAPAAAGPSITLNGVKIDGVTGQRFENCTVTIDENGDVHIVAKGYSVTSGGDGGARRSAPGGAALEGGTQGRVTRRYFLYTEQKPPGAQFDLNVFINAQWIREVKANEIQTHAEITKYLRPGPNKITLAATKRIVGDRLAFGSDVALRIVIGEGNVGGDHLMIDRPLVETARTAAEIDDKTEEFVIDAR